MVVFGATDNIPQQGTFVNTPILISAQMLKKNVIASPTERSFIAMTEGYSVLFH